MSLLLHRASWRPFTSATPRLTNGLAARPLVVGRVADTLQRGKLQVVCAEDKKALPKKMDSQVKRVLISEERRMHNRSIRSATNTSIKKVIKCAEQLVKSPPKTEEDIKELELLVSLAFKKIDSAASKGIYHINTAARKKARCSRYKKVVLLAAGLYVPAPDSPDYAKYKKLIKA